MKEEQRKHRLSIEITDEMYTKLNKIFDHGERRKLVVVLLDKFFEVYSKHGNAAKYAIMAGKLDLLTFVKKKGK